MTTAERLVKVEVLNEMGANMIANIYRFMDSNHITEDDEGNAIVLLQSDISDKKAKILKMSDEELNNLEGYFIHLNMFIQNKLKG